MNADHTQHHTQPTLTLAEAQRLLQAAALASPHYLCLACYWFFTRLQLPAETAADPAAK